ncbi:MAG: efflux RND transporter periplasmic adaptor subunit [Cyanobacteria bacterium P01_H01_bin.74]
MQLPFKFRLYPWMLLILTATTIGLSSVLFSGCNGLFEKPMPVVDVLQVSTAPWTVTYDASGTVEANKKVDLNAEVMGTVAAVLVSEGQAVKKGQVLMRLKNEKQRAQAAQSSAGILVSQQQVSQQAAAIQQAEARVSSTKTQLDLAQSELTRYQKLYEQDYISQLERDQRESKALDAAAMYQESLQALAAAKASFQSAKASVTQAQSTFRYNQALQDETIIRTPFSGTIGYQFVKLGAHVGVNEKLLTLVDARSFDIRFSVPERFLTQLKLGMPVQVFPTGQTEKKPLVASVDFIDPVIDEATHSIQLKARVNASERLKHGLFCTVKLALKKLSNVVVLPDDVIVPLGEKTLVYILEPDNSPPGDPEKKKEKENATANTGLDKAQGNGRLVPMIARQREVIIENRNSTKVQLKRGLTAGTLIVRNGLQKVQEGLKVNARFPEKGLSVPLASSDQTDQAKLHTAPTEELLQPESTSSQKN